MEFNQKKIIIKLKEIIKEINNTVNVEKKIIEELDSFELIELMTNIENYFNINISAEEFNSQNFSDYNELSKLILKKYGIK